MSSSLELKTPGARGEIIVYTTHSLVVERSYFKNIDILCRSKLRCKLTLYLIISWLKYKVILAIHPVYYFDFTIININMNLY